jgi:hypothetical protein
MRAPGLEDPMIDDTSTVTLSGHFTITPRLKATDGMMLALHLRQLEKGSTSCPWRVAGCGSLVIAREAIFASDDLDTWIAVINHWLTTHGYELGSFVCFRGQDPSDQGVITYDGRVVLLHP